MGRKKVHDELLSSILPLARRIAALQKEAAKLGLFMDEREFIKCAGCDFMEDVTFDRRLVTYHRGFGNFKDSGLRFEKKWKNIYKCPLCGMKNKIKNLD